MPLRLVLLIVRKLGRRKDEVDSTRSSSDLRCARSGLRAERETEWRAGVSNFGKVKYESVWPGIDLVWYGNQRLLEHDFVIAPGADPRKIQLEFSGARQMSIDAQGGLELRTDAGDVRLLRPVAWQESNGGRQEVACDYHINDEKRVEFQLGGYDRNRELVIDPAITLSTWFGGADVDEARGVAVDKDGAVYIAGTTASLDFPVTGPVQQNNTALTDAFVLKLSPDGMPGPIAAYLNRRTPASPGFPSSLARQTAASVSPTSSLAFARCRSIRRRRRLFMPDSTTQEASTNRLMAV